MNVLSPPTSIKSYNATKTRWILVWKWCKCLNWRDLFLCPAVNAGEREAQCAGSSSLPPAHPSSEKLTKSYFYYPLQLYLVQITPGKASTFSLLFFWIVEQTSLEVSLIQYPAYGRGRWECSRLCPVEVWFGLEGPGSLQAPVPIWNQLINCFSYWIST